MNQLADSHMHLFQEGFPGKYGALFPQKREVEIYEAARKIHEIRFALVVGYEGEEWAKGNNAYIEKIARTRSWIKPLAYASTIPLPPVAQLRKWMQQKFCGISLYVSDEAMKNCLLAASDEWVSVLNDKRAIVSINCPPKIAKQLRPLWLRLNQTRILISHLGLPGALATAAKKIRPVLDLADLPHVGVKFSAFYDTSAYPHTGIAPLIDQLIERFTVSRLYWGSDFSPALDFVTFAQSIDGMPGGFRTKRKNQVIFHDNLQKAIDRVKSV